MKKLSILFLALFVLTLTSCSEESEGDTESDINIEQINEEVDEELAEDTVEVLQILDIHIEKSDKPDFEEEDAEVLRDYLDKYNEKKQHKELSTQFEGEPEFTTSDYQTFMRTETLILSFGPDALVNDNGVYVNGTSSTDVHIEDIIEIIEDGFQKKK